MSLFSTGTHNQPTITTLFGPPKIPDTAWTPENQAYPINRRSLGKTLIVLGAFLLLWSGCVIARHRWAAPAPWRQTDATVLGGKIQTTPNACPPGWHAGDAERSLSLCDYYVFRFGVSYFVDGAARQSEVDSPLFTYKSEAENWASHFGQGRSLAIIYDPSDTNRVRRADDPPPFQSAAGPAIIFVNYPLGMAYPGEPVEAAAVMRLGFYLLVPGVVLILSWRCSERRKLHQQ